MKRKMKAVSLLLAVAMIVGMFPVIPVNTVSAASTATAASDLILRYMFDEGSGTAVADSSGHGNNGTLSATGATWTSTSTSSGAIALNGGYVQMPNGILSGLSSITVSTNVYVNTINNPSWVFNFRTVNKPDYSGGDPNCHYFGLVLGSNSSANEYRTVLTQTRWDNEKSTAVAAAFPTGVWKNVTYTQTGTTGTLYVDGTQVAQNTSVTYTPNDIEATAANFIGKPCYDGDKYFNGTVSDFRIYNRALDASEVQSVWAESLSVSDIKERLDLGDISAVKNNLSLPGAFLGAAVSWSSDTPAVIANDGTVTRPDTDTTVNLTATISKDGSTDTKTFTAKVLKKGTVYTLDSTSYTIAPNQTHNTVLTATYADLTTMDVTSGAAITSSDITVASVDAAGVVTGLKAGNAVISVVYDRVTYTANVTVANDKILWYKLDETTGTTATDSSGNGNNGTLNGGAAWSGGDGVSLDGSNGYIKMPDKLLTGLSSVTVITDIYIDSANNYPSWLFTFGTTDDTQNVSGANYFGFLFSTGAYRTMLSDDQWKNEKSTEVKSGFKTGEWKNVAYTQTGTTGTLYVDGVKVAQNTAVTLLPSDMENTLANFIGKPPYKGDKYLKAKVKDFRLYNRALSAAEVSEIGGISDADAVAKDASSLTLGDTSAVVSNLTLPASGESGTTISWDSSNKDVIDNTGKVTRPASNKPNAELTLTATISKGSASSQKAFNIKVLSEYTDQDRLDLAASTLNIPNAADIRGNITLPETAGEDNIPVVWSANPTGIINTTAVSATDNGNYAKIPAGVVTRGASDTAVKLTASLTYNGTTVTKDFNVTVKAKPEPVNESDLKGYMFAYFNGSNRSDAEQIYFASSKDALHWKELNNNDPVLTSKLGDKGVRDPFILRSPEGDKFYLIATDLRIANTGDWGAAQTAGSKSIAVWESDDLVNWSDMRLVKIARDDAGCTWAPEAIYDDKTGEYIIYWASRVGEDNYAKQRIYITKTRDFYTFTKPEVYIDRSLDVIDATMIKYNGVYYRFSKDEVNKNILIDTCDQLLGKAFTTLPSTSVGAEQGVEGPAIFKFNGENKWCLLVDNYGGGGYYPLVSDNIASGVFKKLSSSEYKLPSGPRHGTVMPITQKEYDALQAKWGDNVTPPAETEQQNPVLSYNFDETASGNAVQDSSGNSRTGTLFGNAKYVTDTQKNSQVLYLDGTSNTYMQIPTGFFDGRDTVSISMDVKPEMDAGNYFTFTFGRDTSRYMFLKTQPASIRSAITTNSWGSEESINSSVNNIKDVWTNIKVVLTPTTMTLYKDGVQIERKEGLTNTVSSLGSKLISYLGKSFYNDPYFKGYYDNVKVYNRELSETEIANEFGLTVQAVKGVSASGTKFIYNKVDAANKKVTVYVKKGTDLKAVPLELILTDGATVSPAQKTTVDLTKPVTYTVTTSQNNTEVWTVESVQTNNPVLPGLYADPDIDVFGNTYYIYPTTDGFTGWSGTQFHCFSSKDMINWTDHGVILDAGKDKDVPWAVGSAWAPTIEQKNGKYYYYFCAKRSDGKSCIGVAVANSPTGPFTAQATPLITPENASGEGISMGQTIDPSVFTDDDGKSYLLFGNGNAAVVELNDDMISYKTGTMKNITGAYDFREAITVTKRDGIYHFTWSCDDTGSENYHINYGTSNSIYGPITYKYPILSKDASNGILGTGHHSIVKVPGVDEYYIAYHRFGTPLKDYPGGKGYNRETCIDKLKFGSDGLMKAVTPTMVGITNIPGVKPVTGITLDQASLNIEIGSPAQILTATVTPADATNKTVIWSTEDPKIATVAYGIVTPVGAGTTKITARTEDGAYTASCIVTVTGIKVTGIALDQTSLAMNIGDAAKLLTATISPVNASNKKVIWTTNMPAIATVINGTVTAAGTGTAIITAATEDGAYTASCTVTVSPASNGNGGGYIPPNDTNAPDTKTPDTKTPDTKIPDTKTPDTKTPDTKTSDTTPEKVFNDMGTHKWAQEAVETLAAKGIVSGTSDNTYTPGKNITRADFITLLIKALGLKADFNSNFGDVTSDAYYYQAVGIAKQLGITSGTSDGNFNPKTEISRQDMMVMVVKALKASGVKLEGGSASDIKDFKDAEKVSGYASEAVAALIKEGIIKGSGNSINPKDQLTRAEAAVVVYKIYSKQ
jgi:beta-xylosidase